jgi:hypothetical protein
LGRVPLSHALDALMLIPTCLEEVLVRLIDLILIELQLRARQVELILQRGFLRIAGLGHCRGQPLDRRLVGVEPLLRFLQPLLELLGCGTQYRRMGFDTPQGGGECQVELVIGQSIGGLRKGPFVGTFGFHSQASGERQGTLVDPYSGLSASLRITRLAGASLRLARVPPSIQRCGKQDQENGRGDLLQRAHHWAT